MQDWSKMTDEELYVEAFGEGIPPVGDTEDERLQRVITISMDSENTQMPFGLVKTAPFLELFWRKTGTDCDGEEEFMDLVDGNTYLICLATHCE
jgi:hypothetical protein